MSFACRESRREGEKCNKLLKQNRVPLPFPATASHPARLWKLEVARSVAHKSQRFTSRSRGKLLGFGGQEVHVLDNVTSRSIPQTRIGSIGFPSG